MVTFHVSAIEDALIDILAPLGTLPKTLNVIESLLGSIALTVIQVVVLTVTLISVGPEIIFGGKLSDKDKR